MKKFILETLLITVLPVSAQSPIFYNEIDTTSFNEIHSDSLWYDSITGDRIHLQRFFDEDTLTIIKPKPLLALAEDLGVNAAILGWDYFVQDRSYARISRGVLKDHFKHGFVWDNDSFSGNQFSHPYHGAMFYNTARENGLSYGVSLLYPILGSATWEYLCETNPPSINDLLSTGVGGAAIGEVTHRASDIFFDNSKTGLNRVIREIIGSALNPVRAVQRLVSGDMWRVSRVRGKRIVPQPYAFKITVGDRLLTENSNGEHNTLQTPFVKFDFDYGKRFTSAGKNRPFELFNMSLLANMSGNHPSVGEMEIKGRIASKQLELRKDWDVDLGFYQMVKYVDHYGKDRQNTRNFPIISEAVSFGGGIYAEKRKRRSMLCNDFILSAVILGGSNSDNLGENKREYFYPRRYNFGSGFSVREKFEFSISQRFTVGDNLYFMELFVPSNATPDEIEYKLENKISVNSMGDRGSSSIIYNKAYVNMNLLKNMKLGFEYTLYYRHSNYRYFSSVTGISQEYRLGLIYSI